MKFCHGRSWFTRVELTIWNVLSLWKIWLKKNILEILTNTFRQPRSQGLNPDLGKAGIKALGTSLIRPQVNVYSLPFTQFADNPGCLGLHWILYLFHDAQEPFHRKRKHTWPWTEPFVPSACIVFHAFYMPRADFVMRKLSSLLGPFIVRGKEKTEW